MPTVRELIMRKGRDLAAVFEDDVVLDAVGVMADRRIGSVVVKSGDRVTGIFTVGCRELRIENYEGSSSSSIS